MFLPLWRVDRVYNLRCPYFSPEVMVKLTSIQFTGMGDFVYLPLVSSLLQKA